MLRVALALTAIATATPASAETVLETGLAGALRGCEEWVLNPASWSEGPEPFIAAVNLGSAMGYVPSVDAAALPPEPLRVDNHYWRINSAPDAGYVLAVSATLPMCHITGGGNADLQPAVEAVLASAEFLDRWKEVWKGSMGDMASTTYQHREEPALLISVSRADSPGQELDRVQLLATAVFDLEQ